MPTGTLEGLQATVMAIKELVEVLTRQRGDGANAAVTQEDAEAMLDGPALGGKPTAPTAEPGTATEQIATTKFVTDAIAEVESELRGEIGSLLNPDSDTD